MAEDVPQIHFKAPTFHSGKAVEAAPEASSSVQGKKRAESHRLPILRQRKAKQSEQTDLHHGQDIYLGSYSRTSTPRGSIAPSPQESTFHLQLEPLLQAVDTGLDTYGVEELRDGFFDPSFSRPTQNDHDELMQKAQETLPDSFKHKSGPLSLEQFLPQQFRGTQNFFRQITTSHAGLRLLKSFLGFFITYVICLIPASRDWLGRYNYIIVISAIINHPGRSIGSQLDGAFMTILGTAAGLGWGALALYVSVSTPTAQSGFGGVLASFLVVFAGVIGWLRCVFIRFYQAVLSAGIAIFYICLANDSQNVGWIKVFNYGIPWVLGQAICLVVAAVVFPDAGSRTISLAFHDALKTVQLGLALPRHDSVSLKQRTASEFVNVSQAVRDFTIDFTLARFSHEDIREMRKVVQGVLRSILSIRPDTTLFLIPNRGKGESHTQELGSGPVPDPSFAKEDTTYFICRSLRDPTRALIDAMIDSINHADLSMMHIGGHKSLPETQNILQSVDRLRSAKAAFDAADALLVANANLPSQFAKAPDVIELFLFVHPVRQTADKVEALAAKVLDMIQKDNGWHIRAPSQPFTKAIMRTNAQVRHDRGGLTAGFYFRGKRELDKSMRDLQSVAYVPAARHMSLSYKPSKEVLVTGEYQQELGDLSGTNSNSSKKAKSRYKLWKALHRLQGFESRFAFKVSVVTTLISIPAWLPQSRGWWNNTGSWWAVVIVWAMMHPRVGGTFQDLAVRTFCAAIGAVWGGLAYAAYKGNPYIMAVFATVYIIPMLYRFTQSSHPRSGVLGCISFTVVSLSAYTSGGQPSIVTIAWTRGLAFVVGVVAALIVNWVFWPFIARHELRKNLSAMMLHSAIVYRGIIAKYVYYSEGEEPGPMDIARSEMLEGRLREGFVRMRQLMELTRHEMRLRAPFDPLPYSALLSACESFFEHLVQVRQSALYFQPSMIASNPEVVASLTAPRRDAVAVILLNLYILACALRAGRPVPRYLPSAAAARSKLLDRMAVVEAENAQKQAEDQKAGQKERKGRRWADVYQYAYSGALTDIVENLRELQNYTKEIVGETVWDSESSIARDERE